MCLIADHSMGDNLLEASRTILNPLSSLTRVKGLSKEIRVVVIKLGVTSARDLASSQSSAPREDRICMWMAQKEMTEQMVMVDEEVHHLVLPPSGEDQESNDNRVAFIRGTSYSLYSSDSTSLTVVRYVFTH